MKYFILLSVIMVGLYSCAGSNENNEDHTGKHEHAQPQNIGEIDPFCGMTKEDSWTLYSTHGSDTIWFCSDYCKKAFDVNPHKYLGEHTH